MEMVLIEGGTFQMGFENGPSSNISGCSVELSDFYIGKFVVTQILWKKVMGSNHSFFKGDNLPMDSICIQDTDKFIQKLNFQTGKNYRLPLEAEWEYAAKGGNKSKGYIFSGSDILDNVAWYSKNSNDQTHPIGLKQPNELGLYDMSGNVWEWCSDLYYINSDGTTKFDLYGHSLSHVYRGGCYYMPANESRSTYQGGYWTNPFGRYKTFGFRLVHSI